MGRGKDGRRSERGDPRGRDHGGAAGRVLCAKQLVGRGGGGQPGWQCRRFGDQASLHSLGPDDIGITTPLVRRAANQNVRSERLLPAHRVMIGACDRGDGLSHLMSIACQRLVNPRMPSCAHVDPPKSGEKRREFAKESAIPKACPLSVNGGVKFGHCGGAKVGQFGASALERAALI